MLELGRIGLGVLLAAEWVFQVGCRMDTQQRASSK